MQNSFYIRKVGFTTSFYILDDEEDCFCSDLDIDIVDNGDGTVSIYYKVKDAGEYTVSIKFGGQPISGGFYTFTVSRFQRTE